MRLLATFLPDIYKPRGYYHVAFLLADAQTSFGRTLTVSSKEDLVSVLVKMGAERESLELQIDSCGQGGAWIDPSEAQVKWICSRAVFKRARKRDPP